MKVLDLFSGIGGFSLGLERAGMETVAFCEINPYCQRVLAKHWPDVPIYDDIRGLNADTLRRDGIDVDLICGGFPCQDISVAGKGAGLAGERSGLWFEYRRIIGEIRPRWIIIENVPAILARGGSTVVNNLATLGYDCFWECIPASAVGALHRRDRWWCVAYASGARLPHDQRCSSGTKCNGNGATDCGGRSDGEHNQWSIEPDVGRVAHGVPYRVDRLIGLGNAVVPQIPELIGRSIMQTDQHMK